MFSLLQLIDVNCSISFFPEAINFLGIDIKIKNNFMFTKFPFWRFLRDAGCRDGSIFAAMRVLKDEHFFG